jgi:hypothetical protein
MNNSTKRKKNKEEATEKYKTESDDLEYRD